MYRLLIVDDEPIIVDGLIQLFSEQELELELFQAYSVTEALNQAVQSKIDILLTDMKMPGKNGLQLVDEVQTLWPQCRIIFLTGFDDFDYVYNAVKRNIDSYILKTEDDDVLVNAVKESIKIIEEERSLQNEVELSRSQLEAITPFVKQEILEGILQGQSPLDLLHNSIIPKESFAIDFTCPWYVITGKLEELGNLDKDSQNLQNLYLIQEIFLQNLHSDLLVESFIYENQFPVWLLQPKKVEGIFLENGQPKWTRIKEYIISRLESVQEDFVRLADIKISLVIGKNPVVGQLNRDDFQEMAECLSIMAYSMGEMMIVDLSLGNPFSKEGVKSLGNYNWKKELLRMENAIIIGDLEEVRRINDSLFKDIFNDEAVTNIERGEFLCSLSLVLFGFLRNRDLYSYLTKENEELCKLLEGFPSNIDSKRKIDYLLERICHYQSQLREDGRSNIITSINRYINENISGDLSLVTIAKSVFLNPSYLSRFYKEQTGKNISDYINQLKVEKAKYYLSETDLFIQDIATNLGFNSASYFTLFFRKNVNYSPQEYREKLFKR